MTTLLSLRTQTRQRADMENSGFITDSELNGYINASYGELYDLLVSRQEDYFIEESTFTLSNQDNRETLPSDFYKLIGIDFLIDGTETSAVTLRKFNFAERNRFARETAPLTTYVGVPERQYRILGQEIIIMPKGNSDGTYKLWYIPKVSTLTLDADEIDANCDIWAEYIICDAAIKCLVKEESDIQALMVMKQQLVARIEALSANRDSGEAEKIADVTGDLNSDYPFRGGWF